MEAQGYEILEENWVTGKAEVDLIAFKDNKIVFIEVKTRSQTNFGEPEDFVHPAKQRLLQFAAEEYIHLMDFNNEIRFDIIAIVFKENIPVIKHIEDAFWPDI